MPGTPPLLAARSRRVPHRCEKRNATVHLWRVRFLTDVPRRAGLEPVAAAVAAEPVVPTGVDRVGRRVRGLHLHTADRVDGVPLAAAESFAVAIEPVENGESGQERDVQERGVVPLEM